MSELSQVVAVLGRGLVVAGQPVVTADDLGFTRGDGAFDATRVVTADDGSSTVDHLERHLDRLGRSLAGLDADFTDDDRQAWRDLIAEAVEAWTVPGEAILKLMWTRGQESFASLPATGVATITPITQQALADREGVAAVLLDRGTSIDLYRDVPWLLGGVKSLSYAINMAAKREAKRRGATEVVFTSTEGHCLEGPNAALLVWSNGVLSTTPAGASGILHSITQTVAFEGAEAEGVPTEVRLIDPDELFAADGVWLASSIRGTAPIVRLDGREVGVDREFTARLRRWIGFLPPQAG
ncbi:aminotransferase class IV [Aestuariimicrobium ganziense]|uniref:aminotransferase class IV n=1 Tax=Aestuariimicrobium ganziense TaxID=2773677 RepID=UPI001944B86E|nr:aminotransferase class IV [Aestuariimicrobium ganziense]